MNRKEPKLYSPVQTITKTFPNKIEHIRLKHAILINSKKNPTKRQNLTPEEILILDEENKLRSMRRTQKEIQELIECNDFDWFGTFTFNPKKIDRYNDELVRATMAKWLNNQRRLSPNMYYLLVPERHKDGALHFHVLLGNYNGKMADSGSKWLNNPIYNVTSFPYGFTNFTKIRDKAKTANYCRKYISKDIAQADANQKRYWRSKNLKKAVKTFNETRNEILELWLKNSTPDEKGHIDASNISYYSNNHVEITTFPLKS